MRDCPVNIKPTRQSRVIRKEYLSASGGPKGLVCKRGSKASSRKYSIRIPNFLTASFGRRLRSLRNPSPYSTSFFPFIYLRHKFFLGSETIFRIFFGACQYFLYKILSVFPFWIFNRRKKDFFYSPHLFF